MHPRSRRRSGILASAVVLTLLAAPVPALAAPDAGPVPDAASSSDGTRRAVTRDPMDKITPAATRAFQARATTDFWLRFSDDADLSGAKAITSWEERGEYVYETLTATADATQGQAIAELERSGTAYTSFWATNAILVEDGSLDLATDLAADTQVAEVRPTTRHALDEPEATDVAAPSAGTGATYGIEAIRADAMWELGFTGDGIVVAGLDTGVSRDHPALSRQYRGAAAGSDDYHWYDSLNPGRAPRDDDGHGTHTMGTMVGTDDGATDIGVAPGARWIATNGCAGGCLDATLVASGQWLLAPTRWDGTGADPAQRPHVVNNSWGLPLSSDPFLEDVTAAWEAAGIFSTWSNGNDGDLGCDSSASPGSRQASYSVGAFGPSGSIAPWSSRGPGQSGTVKPDIAAPGTAVRSAVPGGGYEQWSGTSMAAPHVAGAVALLWDAVPELMGDVARTRAILDDSAADRADTSCGGTTDDNNVWGEGRLDVLAAYELATERAFETATTPTVSGTAYRVGTPLTAAVAAWSPAAELDYQWRRDGQMISGATRRTYTPAGADAGARLTVTVVGSAAGRTPTARTSAETPDIAVGDLATSAPAISGKVRVGSTLRAFSGSWTSGTRFEYRWYANGAAIRGATGFTFTPSAAQRGKRLTVRLTGTRRGFAAASRTSPASVAVASGRFAQSAPVVLGAAVPGATLKVSRPQSVPVPGSVAYRWKVDGRSVRGATGTSLSVRSSWKGRKITVSATVRRTGYSTRTVTSAAAKVGSAYTRSPAPRISGTVRVGSRLRASAGRWSPRTSLSYRWYADGRPVSGATRSSYTLKGAQYGQRITVVVRSYRARYGTVTRRSAPTRTVLTPALKFPGDDTTAWYVGPDSVPAGTYVTNARAAQCRWERYGSGDEPVASDVGRGQRLVKVQSTDHIFWSSSTCGTWTKYYPGMVRTRASTASHGVHVLGDQLERGTYVTAGPKDPNIPCHYVFYKGFYGGTGVLGHGAVTEARTVRTPSAAIGFETIGCSWRRVG